MHLRAEHADRRHRAVAADDGLDRNDPCKAGVAHRRGIDRTDVDFLPRRRGCCRRRAAAGARRRAPPGSATLARLSRIDDRLLHVAHLQRDGAIPVARVAQLELLAKRAEPREPDVEPVLALPDRRELEAPACIRGYRPRDLVGIHERHFDARQHGAGDVVDPAGQRRRAGLARAKGADRQRDEQDSGAEHGHGAPRGRTAVESRVQHGGNPPLQS